MYRTFKNLLWTFPLSAFVIVVMIGVLITVNTDQIELGKSDFSEKGWNIFVSVFKVPLSLLAICIPVYGIIVALYQSSLAKSNIFLNNYYKQMEEFQKLVQGIGESNELKDILTRHFARDLFIRWFGNKFETDHKINPHIYDGVRQLYKGMKDLCNDVSDPSLDLIEHMYAQCERLGLTPLFGYHISQAKQIFYLCEAILDFSDQRLSLSETPRECFDAHEDPF